MDQKNKIQYLFEGVYGVTIKDHVDTAAAFYDWLFLQRPYINKVWLLDGQNYYVLAASSGTPPNGQVLLLRAAWDLGQRLFEEQQKEEALLIESNIPHPLVVL